MADQKSLGMIGSIISGVTSVVIAGIAGAGSAQAGTASAQGSVRVGYAMLVERDVSASLLGGELRRVFKNDDVHENEFIRTEPASTARLFFIDKTQLVLGPTTTAKLDRLIYNPDKSVKALTVSARTGTIRWISGNSDSSAYQIEASTVVIRPHGTIFDTLVEPHRTTVVLQEGIIEACLIDAPQRCRVLSRRGEMITATRTAITAPQLGGPGVSEFEDRCLSAASKGCVIGISVPPSEPPAPKLQKRAEPRSQNIPKKASVEPKSKKTSVEPKAKKASVEPKAKVEAPQPPKKKKIYPEEPQPLKVTEAPSQAPDMLPIIGGGIAAIALAPRLRWGRTHGSRYGYGGPIRSPGYGGSIKSPGYGGSRVPIMSPRNGSYVPIKRSWGLGVLGSSAGPIVR
jgi:hypothetical protein